MSQLKISARNAGQVELAKFCPRCSWYLLRMKKAPYQFGMPGILFDMERAQKAFLSAYLEKHGELPKYFGAFADCVDTVDFESPMEAEHPSGVMVTARPDIILRKDNDHLTLVDLKTSKQDGGGKIFLPQYEIQVIGYSWVCEQVGLGTMDSAGLFYCENQRDEFIKNPLKYLTESGFDFPFAFKAHEVKLDYDRLGNCLKVMKGLWDKSRPPMGTENCKDCSLLQRWIGLDNNLGAEDETMARSYPFASDYMERYCAQRYYRMYALSSAGQSELLIDHSELEDGGVWANWDFA